MIRRIEIIGEAARQLPQDVKERHPEIPWVDIISMRNRVSHGYFGVILDRVWGVVEQDLPVLKPQIEQLRKALDEEAEKL